MKTLVLEDAEHAARHCAVLVAEIARAAIAARGRACLALSGGRTPWLMVQTLAREHLPWRDVHIFQTDERVAPLGGPERTLTHLSRLFLSSVPLPPDHVHPMPVDEPDLVAAARRYGILIERIVGLLPALDVIHLGLGADGHTASLIPGDPVLNVTDADVSISGPYLGHERMTLTYPILNRAKQIIWLATGREKADVLKRLFDGDTQIPAGRVSRGNAIVVADRSAAQLLRKKAYEHDCHEI
ncbi:MAG: 6-phosphogluconolactonase [Pseudolabrys sp.]